MMTVVEMARILGNEGKIAVVEGSPEPPPRWAGRRASNRPWPTFPPETGIPPAGRLSGSQGHHRHGKYDPANPDLTGVISHSAPCPRGPKALRNAGKAGKVVVVSMERNHVLKESNAATCIPRSWSPPGGVEGFRQPCRLLAEKSFRN
jgi:ABC-type sugar transport system substrate-binding protein